MYRLHICIPVRISLKEKTNEMKLKKFIQPSSFLRKEILLNLEVLGCPMICVYRDFDLYRFPSHILSVSTKVDSLRSWQDSFLVVKLKVQK